MLEKGIGFAIMLRSTHNYDIICNIEVGLKHHVEIIAKETW
jgi:hypothetical protein